MITLYSGEIFINPIPLHLSLNYCSHKCAYCFANLNNPGRSFDAKKFQSQIKNYWKQDNLVAQLMRDKYPVLLSNTVDPFATSNYQYTQPIMDQLNTLEIPVTFQTRGASNAKAEEALYHVIETTPSSLWYISITTTDEKIRQKVEPGAPAIAHRLALIDKLISHGHRVAIGINPFEEEWIPDLDGFVSTLYGKGVRNIWFGVLHFNNMQVANMTESEKIAIGAKRLTQTKKQEDTKFDNLQAKIDNFKTKYPDLHCFLSLDGKENHFFDIYAETYQHKFPVFNDFFNWVYANKKPGDLIYFNELSAIFKPQLPKGKYDFSGLAYAAQRGDYKKPEIREFIMSFKEVSLIDYVRTLWNNEKFGFKLNRKHGYASLVHEVAQDEYALTLDEQGNEIFVFDPINNHDQEMYVTR